MTYVETRKTCLIYSPGGHYTELSKALDGITFSDCYHVTFPLGDADHYDDTQAPRFYLTHPRRNPFRLLRNALESWRLLKRERPALILSTGADVAAATLILGKMFFGCRTVFIESAGDIRPTLTGRLVYPFCDLFIIQWPEKQKHFPRAVLSEGILL